MNKLFLEQYNAAIASKYGNCVYSAERDKLHADRALCLLLERYVDNLPDITDERFHTTFRKADIADTDAPEELGGKIDMAIWHLLHGCNFFWEVREKFINKNKKEN